MEFEKEPERGSRLEILLGASQQLQSISSSTFDWKQTSFDEFDQKIPWWIAFSEARYEIERPTWLVLTGAELLEGAGGASLLRISVNNPTENTASIQHVKLIAVSPVDKGYSCNVGDPVQKVELKWDLVPDGNRDAITTTLDGVELPVVAEYNFEGGCSKAYSIEADIPVTKEIPQRTTSSIVLRVKELPPNEGRTRSSLSLFGRETAPSKLAEWTSLQVGILSDGTWEIRPGVVDVEKPNLSKSRGVADPKSDR